MTEYEIPRPTSGDVTELIKEDHRLFEEMLRQMRDVDADRDAVRQAFAELLVAHSEAEEHEVYPKLKTKKVIAREEEEHGERGDEGEQQARGHGLELDEEAACGEQRGER